MTEKHEILTEIHRLLDQQSAAIKGKLGPLEAVQYACRARRIQELFQLLSSEHSSNQ